MSKVLHVVENFNGQATERWLLQAFEALQENGEKVDWSFFCTLDRPGKFSHKIIEHGGKVICSPMPISRLISFMKFLRGTIQDGSYEIIHCHQDLMSAIYLLASLGLPVRKRIVHVHNTSLSLPTQNWLKIFFLKWIFRLVCIFLADHIVGVSEDALKAFHKGLVNKHMSVLHCGIDLRSFHNNKMCSGFRESLGIPCEAIVLLFVGRMTEYKNPCFVIDILEELSSSLNNFYAIFAGTGPLESVTTKYAAEKNVSNRVRVLGWQDDIALIMRSCDILIWPGLETTMEGLGLAVVEAQAAGLKIIMSRNVPAEAIIIPELIDIRSLAEGSKVWADTILAALERDGLGRKEALEVVEKSSFSISRSASNIELLYNS